MPKQHTPGPWVFVLARPRYWLISHVENHAGQIMVRAVAELPDNAHALPADEQEANARLIAAAPDLLAALVALVESGACLITGGTAIDDTGVSKCAWCRARTAIAELRLTGEAGSPTPQMWITLPPSGAGPPSG